MNTDDSKTTRTTKKTTTVIVGVITLAIGVLIGLAVTKSRAGNSTGLETAKTPASQMASASAPGLNATGPAEWNPFQEIRNLQMQMDQMLNQMSDRFRMEPQLNYLQENPGYSYSLNVQDLKDRYEVRAFLPDAKASDVNVSLEGNQTLKVQVSNKNTETSGKNTAATSVTEWGQYEQTIQLPTPVKADHLKIERKDHELLITIPKA